MINIEIDKKLIIDINFFDCKPINLELHNLLLDYLFNDQNILVLNELVDILSNEMNEE